MESTVGAEETHTRSPQNAQTSLCRRGFHGRDIRTQQRSIVVSDGSNLPCSVGLCSGLILPGLISMGAWRMQTRSVSALALWNKRHRRAHPTAVVPPSLSEASGREAALPWPEVESHATGGYGVATKSSLFSRAPRSPRYQDGLSRDGGLSWDLSRDRPKIGPSAAVILQRKVLRWRGRARRVQSLGGSGPRTGGNLQGNEKNPRALQLCRGWHRLSPAKSRLHLPYDSGIWRPKRRP